MTRTEKSLFLFYFIGTVVMSSIIVLFLLCTNGECQLKPAKDQAIRAIIGEAGNQGYKGMLAVACAIRNRGTLKGVYGAKAKHIDKQSEDIWLLAEIAWDTSEVIDIVNGADHWENTKAFGKPYWAKSMQLVYSYKNHNFYK